MIPTEAANGGRAALAAHAETARAAEAAAERRWLRLRAAVESSRAALARDEAARAAARARAIAESLRAARAAAAEVPPLAAGAVRGAEELAWLLAAREAARDAASARVELAVEGALEAVVGGERVALGPGAALVRAVAGRLELVIPGVGRLTVDTGGDAARLAAEAADLRARLDGALAALGVARPEEARTRLERRRGLDARVRELEAQLHAVALEGLPYVEDRLSRAEEAAAAAATAFRALDRAGDRPLPPAGELRGAAIDAEVAWRAAAKVRAAADAALARHDALAAAAEAAPRDERAAEDAAA